MYSKFLLAPVIILTPLVTMAASPTDLKSFLGIFTNIISLLVPIIFGLIVLTISWGVTKAWIMGDASSEDVEQGKKVAIVGIIVLAIMVSLWGIVRMISTSFFG